MANLTVVGLPMESLFTLIGLKWAGYFLSFCKFLRRDDFGASADLGFQGLSPTYPVLSILSRSCLDFTSTGMPSHFITRWVTVPLSPGLGKKDNLTNDVDTGSSNHHFWDEESSWTEFWCSYSLVDCKSGGVVRVHGVEDPSKREAREA